MLIAYTLLRRQMRLMAERIKVEPLRMGFHSTSIAIIDVLRHRAAGIRRHATQTLGFIIRAGPPVCPASPTRRSHLSQSRQTPSEQVSPEKCQSAV